MVIHMKFICLFSHFGAFSFLNFGFLGRNMRGTNNTVRLLTLLRLMPNTLVRGCFTMHSIHDILLSTYVTIVHWLQELGIRVCNYNKVAKFREVIRYVAAGPNCLTSRGKENVKSGKTINKVNILWTHGEIPSIKKLNATNIYSTRGFGRPGVDGFPVKQLIELK